MSDPQPSPSGWVLLSRESLYCQKRIEKNRRGVSDLGPQGRVRNIGKLFSRNPKPHRRSTKDGREIWTRTSLCLSVSVVNYSGRIPITAIILPVLPNSARCEKNLLVSHAVHPSMMEICSGRTPASSS